MMSFQSGKLATTDPRQPVARCPMHRDQADGASVVSRWNWSWRWQDAPRCTAVFGSVQRAPSPSPSFAPATDSPDTEAFFALADVARAFNGRPGAACSPIELGLQSNASLSAAFNAYSTVCKFTYYEPFSA